jgi:hypothetical protein
VTWQFWEAALDPSLECRVVGGSAVGGGTCTLPHWGDLEETPQAGVKVYHGVGRNAGKRMWTVYLPKARIRPAGAAAPAGPAPGVKADPPRAEDVPSRLRPADIEAELTRRGFARDPIVGFVRGFSPPSELSIYGFTNKGTGARLTVEVRSPPDTYRFSADLKNAAVFLAVVEALSPKLHQACRECRAAFQKDRRPNKRLVDQVEVVANEDGIHLSGSNAKTDRDPAPESKRVGLPGQKAGALKRKENPPAGPKPADATPKLATISGAKLVADGGTWCVVFTINGAKDVAKAPGYAVFYSINAKPGVAEAKDEVLKKNPWQGIEGCKSTFQLNVGGRRRDRPARGHRFARPGGGRGRRPAGRCPGSRADPCQGPSVRVRRRQVGAGNGGLRRERKALTGAAVTEDSFPAVGAGCRTNSQPWTGPGTFDNLRSLDRLRVGFVGQVVTGYPPTATRDHDTSKTPSTRPAEITEDSSDNGINGLWPPSSESGCDSLIGVSRKERATFACFCDLWSLRYLLNQVSNSRLLPSPQPQQIPKRPSHQHSTGV